MAKRQGLGKRLLRGLAGIVIIAVVMYVVRSPVARGIVQHVLAYISGLGAWAPVLFILAYIAACLTFFPGVLLTMGAGVLFGLALGTLYVAIGASLGAACAFLLSRYVARGWVLRRFGNYPHFKALDDAVAKEGWKLVGLIRLSPAFPFIAMNFIFGLTRISFIHFFVATAIGILPLTALFVCIGWLTGDLAEVSARPPLPGNLKYVILSVACVSIFLVTGFVNKIVRRALAQEAARDLTREAYASKNSGDL
jgi:uncharacterized membrane protein YdjX (TVP38/TMEM64 family)